ncbi:MAG TPA: hypothetical protein VH206_01245 [Xanthobacteraceae bacterium]|nr:hypothetical protein [Xanthobacteraceae bacterium]
MSEERTGGDEEEAGEGSVPYDAITFTEAYEAVLAVVQKNPPPKLEIDDDWSEVLNASRAFERSVQDPSVFTADLEEYWHLSKVANVFLRSQLECGRPIAAIRDPRTGQLLRIISGGWLPSVWMKREYVPSGIWSDFVDASFYDALGPDGAFVRGHSCRIFFLRLEFERWFEDVFESLPDFSLKVRSADQQAGRAALPSVPPSKRKHWRIATKDAILRVYGSKGPPDGLPERDRNAKVNDYLKGRGIVQVSDSTIRRALKELRSLSTAGDRS